MLSGDNSILSRATEARDKTIESQSEEQTGLTQMSAALNLEGTVTSEGIKIPAGFAVSEKDGENTLADGLVIKDASGNEYVWIEVPKTVTASATTDGEIYNALREYCGEDANNETLIESTGTNPKTTTRGWTDEYYEGCGLSQSEYNALKSKMLNSIKDNGGFWIGRYEAGIEGSDKDLSLARQSHTDISAAPKPVSKPDCIPYNWITCSEAETLAKIAGGSLMFGIQWDLVIKYLNNKGVATNLLTVNSEEWGNYRLEYNLNQKIAHGYKGVLSTSDYSLTWNAVGSGYVHTAGTNEYIALSTGATKRNKNQNIYDLAGNVYEWTLEHSTYVYRGINFTCVGRGGYFYGEGSDSPVSCRSVYATSNSNFYIGFRVSLY